MVSSNQRVVGSICDPPCMFYEAESCMCAHLEAGGYVKHFGDAATQRKTIPCEKHWAGNPGPTCCPWCEIERLRAENAELINDNDAGCMANTQLNRTVERLRAALKRYGQHQGSPIECRPPAFCLCGLEQLLREAAPAVETTASAT